MENSTEKQMAIWLFVSNLCNCRCKYCYVPPLEKQILMSKENIKKFLDISEEIIESKDLDCIRIRLSGGEPLLAFDNFKDILTDLDEKKFILEMNTNLTIYNDEILEYLSKNKIGIGVSLDDLYFQKPFIDGSSSSKTVINNLYKYWESGRSCGVCSVIDYENNYKFNDLAKFVAENSKFIGEWMVGIDFTDFSLNSEKEDRIVKILNEMVDTFCKYSKDINILKIMNVKFSDYTYCPAGRTLISVSEDLKASACQALIGKVDFGDYDINIMKKLKTEKTNEYYYSNILPSACKDCGLSVFCNGGCKLQHENTNNLNHLCNIRKRIFRHIKRYL